MAQPSDAGALLEIYRPIVETTYVSFELSVPTEAEMARRLEATLAARPWLVCTRDGVVAGYAYADPYRVRPAYQWTAETTVYVAEGQRRRGVARALYVALLELLKRQGFATAFAVIAQPNPASVAFHESLGFARVGLCRRVGFKLDRWHDVGWWQIDLDPRVEAPAGAPAPISSMVGTAEWTAALASGERILQEGKP